jgi:hypothetical protein
MILLGHEQQEIVENESTPRPVAEWAKNDDPEAYGFDVPNYLIESAEDVDAKKMLYMIGTDQLISPDLRKYEFAVIVPGGEFVVMAVPGMHTLFIPRAVMNARPQLWTEYKKVNLPD